LLGSVGPGKLLDSSKYYVIAIGPLTNGVSSSPSNSALQPRMQFPKITIRDMVDAEYRTLTEILHVGHLKAVLGVSMEGQVNVAPRGARP
jgi:homoserine O-acetyltransferase/O-succinyltransferase